MLARKPGAKPRLIRVNGLLAHQASNRIDPTKTTGLRNRFAAEMGRRFFALRRLIWKALVQDDVFGLGPAYKMYRPTVHIELTTPGPRKFDFPLLQDKTSAFMEWLQEQERLGILETITLPRLGESLGTPWTNIFIKDSYSRGVIRAREQLMSAGYGAPGLGAGDLPLMGLPGMTSGIFANPFHSDRLASVFLRSYDGLKGISSAMSMQISHVLAQGLADGDNPITLAKKMNYVISGMGKDLGITDSLGRFIPAERRAKMLARTEVIRAHHLATVQEYRNWGVAGVNVVAEWVTAGFNVCPICNEIARKGPYTLDQVQNMLPAHPHCRCTTYPRPMGEINVHSNPCHNPAGPGGGQFCGGGFSGGPLSTTSKSDFNSVIKKFYESQGKANWEDDYFGGLKLRGYFGNPQSFQINKYLRGDRSAGDSRVKQVVKDLKGSLDSHGLDIPGGSMVYRAVSGKFAEQLMAMSPGQSFVDKGWTSTAGIKSATSRFGKTIMHITLKGGKRALVYTHETEVLFPPGSKLVIMGLKKSGNKTIINMEMY